MPLIDKTIIRRVERELYSYPQYTKDTAERRDELIYGTPRMEGERTCNTNKTDNPTMMRGVGLAELSEGWGGLITSALKQMPNEHRQIIQGMYFKGMRGWQVADMLHVSVPVVYAWKDNAVMMVLLMATERGLIKPFGKQEREEAG